MSRYYHPTYRSDTAIAEERRTAELPEKAVKIYKTSILVFKDRDKSVSREHWWR